MCITENKSVSSNPNKEAVWGRGCYWRLVEPRRRGKLFDSSNTTFYRAVRRAVWIFFNANDREFASVPQITANGVLTESTIL